MGACTSTFDLTKVQTSSPLPSFFDIEWPLKHRKGASLPQDKIKDVYKTIVCRLIATPTPFARDDFPSLKELARTQGAEGEDLRKVYGKNSARYYRTNLSTGDQVQNEHPIDRLVVYGELIEIISDAFSASSSVNRLGEGVLRQRMMRLLPLMMMMHIVANDVTIWSPPGIDGHDYATANIIRVGTAGPVYRAVDIVTSTRALLLYLKDMYKAHHDSDEQISSIGEQIKSSVAWNDWKQIVGVINEDPIQFCAAL